MTENEKIIEEVKEHNLPFNSWEILKGESCKAFAAFCVYRDFGICRNIKNAIESVETDKKIINRCYGSWRKWAVQFRWYERAADYDRYRENLKQEEFRKTIEAQGEKQRLVTGKMLDVVNKKLDLMNPEDLTQNNLTEWVQTAIKAERDMFDVVQTSGLTPNGKHEPKQGEFNFVTEFKGL